MKTILAFSILCAAAISVARQQPAPETAPAPQNEIPAGRVALVELFTAQGCSSCPPADRLLTRLGKESAGRVVPLAYHVDSWNHAGWTDPFSRREWTERQLAYGRAFYLRQVYTPEAVVDGRVEMVGSNEGRVRAALAVSATLPAASISLRVEPSDSQIAVNADVDLPAALRGEKLDLMLAIFETNLVTAVGGGENGGRTLQDDYVVRSLTRAHRLAADGPGRTQHSASLPLQKDWKRPNLGVAAFLQDPRSLAVRGASASPLLSRPGATQ